MSYLRMPDGRDEPRRATERRERRQVKQDIAPAKRQQPKRFAELDGFARGARVKR